MVTKLDTLDEKTKQRSVLAKIHMVTKPVAVLPSSLGGSVLAKIHMVTKQVRA